MTWQKEQTPLHLTLILAKDSTNEAANEAYREIVPLFFAKGMLVDLHSVEGGENEKSKILNMKDGVRSLLASTSYIVCQLICFY